MGSNTLHAYGEEAKCSGRFKVLRSAYRQAFKTIVLDLLRGLVLLCYRVIIRCISTLRLPTRIEYD